MKGGPTDAHFITSRICGICGDNHDVLVLLPEHGVRCEATHRRVDRDLGEAAEYMLDHNIFQENPVGVDYCEMVSETNPVPGTGQPDRSADAGDHGCTVGDIMRAESVGRRLLPRGPSGRRYTREMFCLMEVGTKPLDASPGGVNGRHDPVDDRLPDLLMRCVEFMKKLS
jgi:hydrogenase large subunit